MEAKESTAKEEVKEIKKVYGSYLKDEIVSIKPVASKGKWTDLRVAGQDNKKDPFIYNKVKRSVQVPLKTYAHGGGVVQILDDQKRVLIRQFEGEFPDGMTQKEFFEKELGVNLNTTLEEEKNFWRKDKRSRVTLDRTGIQLNLSIPIDMLRYLILLSCKALIAPSFEESDKKASYEFMIVDEGKLTSKKVAAANLKAKAYGEFALITGSKEKMVGFIKSLGRVIPQTHSEDWLKNEVLTVLENSPENFLSIVNDPNYSAKIFVQNATEVGAIIKKGDKRYTLDNGIELGELTDVINYLGNPEHQDTKMRIKARIDMAKK